MDKKYIDAEELKNRLRKNIEPSKTRGDVFHIINMMPGADAQEEEQEVGK